MIFERRMISSVGDTKIPMDVYLASVDQDINPGRRRPAVLICPGGAYRFCSKREGEAIALRFLSLGFHAFVLWYRTAPNRFPVPQQDAAAAMAYIRAHADSWFVDPDGIAIMGFSAGGHLAGSIGTMWQRAELWEPLGLTPALVKPNAMVLCYPVITGGPFAHRGSFENLLGTTELKQHEEFSLENHVTADCPPAFLWHTFTDGAVPVENSLLMTQALSAAGVPAELHVFPSGGHGASLCDEITGEAGDMGQIIPEATGWPELAARFLKTVLR